MLVGRCGLCASCLAAHEDKANILIVKRGSSKVRRTEDLLLSVVQIARATKRKQNLQKVMAGGQQRQQYIEKTAMPPQGSRLRLESSPFYQFFVDTPHLSSLVPCRFAKTTPMFKTDSKTQRAVNSKVAGTGGHRLASTRSLSAA